MRRTETGTVKMGLPDLAFVRPDLCMSRPSITRASVFPYLPRASMRAAPDACNWTPEGSIIIMMVTLPARVHDLLRLGASQMNSDPLVRPFYWIRNQIWDFMNPVAPA